jgi:RNA recognition motif-containing protein
MSSKLYVGNLPYETSEAELESLFAQSGAVASVNVVRDRETGRPRGFAFVEMATEADAKNAIAQLNERPFGGRKLMVNEARPQVPRGGGGGFRDGGRGGGEGGRGRRSEPRW